MGSFLAVGTVLATAVTRVLGIVYRCIATHLIQKAGFFRKTAQAGAVTLNQRFGSALNLDKQT